MNSNKKQGIEMWPPGMNNIKIQPEWHWLCQEGIGILNKLTYFYKKYIRKHGPNLDLCGSSDLQHTVIYKYEQLVRELGTYWLYNRNVQN